MKWTHDFKRARVLLVSLFLIATPVLAQTDATRLAELEAKTRIDPGACRTAR